jgi:hypothetical protein
VAGDILHFAQAFFLKFRVADGQSLIHNQNLVCSPPCSRSPAGLPAAAYLAAAHRLDSAFRIPRIAPFRKIF